MTDSRLPTEVELIYEVMPCNAMRTAQEPVNRPHACTYFRRWGAYHSYDYDSDGPPPEAGIKHPSEYVGLANLTPEVLSGCRKSPIFVVGINPNLTGYSQSRKNSVYPLFDDYKQFAHYFRYRSTEKLEIPDTDFRNFKGDNSEAPPFLATDMLVPQREQGEIIPLQMQRVTYYHELQKLLNDLGSNMNWIGHRLQVGEDLSYGNMVACPSARWLTSPNPGYPSNLVMSRKEVREIVQECFHERKYFLRQLFQSLPKVIMVVGATTARPFITALQDRFIEGFPQTSETITDLLKRKHILKYGTLPNGTELTARVIFSGHITGDPATYQAVRSQVLAQLEEEALLGNIVYNVNSGHLLRPPGACVLCPMMEIGPCDYVNELTTLTDHPVLTADSPAFMLQDEKKAQHSLMGNGSIAASQAEEVWLENPEDH